MLVKNALTILSIVQYSSTIQNSLRLFQTSWQQSRQPAALNTRQVKWITYSYYHFELSQRLFSKHRPLPSDVLRHVDRDWNHCWNPYKYIVVDHYLLFRKGLWNYLPYELAKKAFACHQIYSSNRRLGCC